MIRRLAALALAVVVIGVLAPATATAAPSASSASCASSIPVAVVVDFGDGSPVSAVCVPAGSTENGAAVLYARAQQLGTPPPRFDQSSGLLCAIDGVPESGCGEQVGGKYAYWSYWHGTSSGWSYSNVGPGGSRVKATTSEGWRYNPQGAGNPSDPPPRGNPDPAATCTPPAEPTTTSAAADPASPTSPTAVAGVTSTSTSTSTSTTDSATSSTTTPASSSAPASGAAAGSVRVTEPGGRSSTSPWPAIGTGGAIGALGLGGFFVARRRRSSSP